MSNILEQDPRHIVTLEWGPPRLPNSVSLIQGIRLLAEEYDLCGAIRDGLVCHKQTGHRDRHEADCGPNAKNSFVTASWSQKGEEQ